MSAVLRPAAVILAAGESRRMEGALKPLLPYRGGTFLSTVVGTLREAGFETIRVVVGARSDEVRAAVRDLPAAFVENPAWRDGMLGSLQAGIASLEPGTPGALVTLVDLPGILTDTIGHLGNEWDRDRSRIVLPVRQDAGARPRRGHPVIFPGPLFAAIRAARHPDGPRGLLRDHAALVTEIPVEDDGCFQDVDTPEDYRVLQSAIRAPQSANR